ncbi:MAG: multicopper oxidase domain-containing protein [Nitrosotalea sp.]
MNSIKIALVALAVSFAAFVSIMGYQCLVVGQEHDHEDYSANLYNFVSPTDLQGQTRTYYIASDEVKWNYAPTGINKITGVPLKDDPKAAVYTISGEDRIGSTYIKCLYRGYTDATFTTQQPVDPKWQHLGMLGPVIHAEVGDTIKVVFKNNCSISTSMHPHGVFYDKADEGAPYDDGVKDSDKPGESIPTGGTYTYTWGVPLRAGPGPHDPSSILWMYHSHVEEVGDTYAGLEGPIIVTKHGEANPDGTPKGVDREFVTMFSVMDENSSPYLDKNIQTFTGNASSVDKDDDDFHESNLMHSINGYVFGNLPGLTMKVNTHVRWYVTDVGTEVDLHTPHWHGNTLLQDGMRTDMVELLPMSMKTLDMYPDNAGTWLYHCHVNDHILAGMLSLYPVTA